VPADSVENKFGRWPACDLARPRFKIYGPVVDQVIGTGGNSMSLRDGLPLTGVILEITSGSGEHIINLTPRRRRKDWHSVRKGACVWVFRRRESAARQTLSPGDRADPGLASVRGLVWLSPNRRREGCIHVDQTYRYAARSAERRSPAQGPLSRRPANAQGRHRAESRE
jgi:hypothetical protein